MLVNGTVIVEDGTANGATPGTVLRSGRDTDTVTASAGVARARVSADGASVVLVDDPAPMVRRITLNRPEKRNALNAALRHEIVAALRDADRDPDVRVTDHPRRRVVLLRRLRPRRAASPTAQRRLGDAPARASSSVR